MPPKLRERAFQVLDLALQNRQCGRFLRHRFLLDLGFLGHHFFLDLPLSFTRSAGLGVMARVGRFVSNSGEWLEQWRVASGEWRVASGEWRVASDGMNSDHYSPLFTRN